jgi:hypothetical protein
MRGDLNATFDRGNHEHPGLGDYLATSGIIHLVSRAPTRNKYYSSTRLLELLTEYSSTDVSATITMAIRSRVPPLLFFSVLVQIVRAA